MMKIELIIYLSLIYLNCCYSATLAPTKFLTITTAKKPLSKCYQSFTGLYQGKQYNISIKTTCNTSCLFYRESTFNKETEFAGLCDNGPCTGGLYVVQNNYSVKYDCCSTDLCNTYNYAQLRFNYTCEFNRKLNKKKLTFPVLKNISNNSVKQCYYCDQCASPKSARVVNCADRNSTITNFSCQFAYVDYGRSSYWNADCYSMQENYFLSIEKSNTRVAGCTSNLCNSPDNMLRLINATLCPDGFYT